MEIFIFYKISNQISTYMIVAKYIVYIINCESNYFDAIYNY
jgi:hypothetical protein